MLENSWQVIYKVKFPKLYESFSDYFTTRDAAISYAETYIDKRPTVLAEEVLTDDNGLPIETGEEETIFTTVTDEDRESAEAAESDKLDELEAEINSDGGNAEKVDAVKNVEGDKTEVFTELPDHLVEIEQKGDKIEIEITPKAIDADKIEDETIRDFSESLIEDYAIAPVSAAYDPFNSDFDEPACEPACGEAQADCSYDYLAELAASLGMKLEPIEGEEEKPAETEVVMVAAVPAEVADKIEDGEVKVEIPMTEGLTEASKKDEKQELLDLLDSWIEESCKSDLSEASSAEKKAFKQGGDAMTDLIRGKAIARVKDDKARDAAIAALKADRAEVAGEFVGDRKAGQAIAAIDAKMRKMEKAGVKSDDVDESYPEDGAKYDVDATMDEFDAMADEMARQADDLQEDALPRTGSSEKYDVAFIDVSGSLASSRNVDAMTDRAKKAGADKIYRFGVEAPDFDKVKAYIDRNKLNKALILTNGDIDDDANGKALKNDPRVTVIDVSDLQEYYNREATADADSTVKPSKDVPVVKCPVNDVITHGEDEKPLDCEMKKKPLEKPLAEDASNDYEGIEASIKEDGFSYERSDEGEEVSGEMYFGKDGRFHVGIVVYHADKDNDGENPERYTDDIGGDYATVAEMLADESIPDAFKQALLDDRGGTNRIEEDCEGLTDEEFAAKLKEMKEAKKLSK